MSQEIKTTVFISGDIATAIYSEDFPATTLGNLSEIKRWSNIEFNNFTGLWDVTLLKEDNRIGFSHNLRSECIKWEKEYFNDKTAITDTI